jgi:hypothetical protein
MDEHGGIYNWMPDIVRVLPKQAITIVSPCRRDHES